MFIHKMRSKMANKYHTMRVIANDIQVTFSSGFEINNWLKRNWRRERSDQTQRECVCVCVSTNFQHNTGFKFAVHSIHRH